ncbi:hypothetical protein BGZ76_005255 [Entomortierella beljakovae]|nr:hypothetical protein BGZ76_005255 [Entomortierella beljakovae]
MSLVQTKPVNKHKRQEWIDLAKTNRPNYCEGLKRDPLGPLYGYYLAHKDNRQPDVVRHFGLGLIEDAVRHRWSDGSLAIEVKAQIRANAISLATEV